MALLCRWTIKERLKGMLLLTTVSPTTVSPSFIVLIRH